MRAFTIFIFSFFLIFSSCTQQNHKTIFAFGSCSYEYDTIQMWNNVIKHNPEAWIWLGDNIYGDSYDMDVMKAKYEMQKSRASYQNLIKATKVFGTWDDHDYGINDGGKEYSMKKESKKLMLNFLDVPKTESVWNRGGIYQSHMIESNGLSIKLILLDTRYFRDSLLNNPDAPPRYLPNHNGTILGEEQWAWLEDQLMNSPADIHLIGSSIQLIPIEQGYEKWGNFPNERKRFLELIKKSNPSRPIILSGDRHIAEFSQIEIEGWEHPLIEFTSSGLTHTWQRNEPEVNSHRINSMVIQKNFGVIEISETSNEIQISLQVRGSSNEILEQTVLYY